MTSSPAGVADVAVVGSGAAGAAGAAKAGRRLLMDLGEGVDRPWVQIGDDRIVQVETSIVVGARDQRGLLEVVVLRL